jgi:Zn-dependent peptidase ImmA (M78 family)
MKKSIELHVENIFKQYNVNKVPVPVEKIALKMNLAITPTDLGPGVSGALIVNDGKATIGINENDPNERRRYTIAHEIGHYILHNELNTLFVEKSYFLAGNENASLSELKKEKEANAFASALLMPDELIKREIEKIKGDVNLTNDEELVSYLAKKFDVSDVAMTRRLVALNYLK